MEQAGKKQPVSTASKMPEDLLKKIMDRINAEREAISIRNKFITALVSFLILFVIAVPTWQYFQTDIAVSGFSQFIRLIFYDFKIVLANWQDYVLSLLETLPVFGAIAMLAVILGFIIALKYISKFGKILLLHSKLNLIK